MMLRPYTVLTPTFLAETEAGVDYLSAIQTYAERRYITLAGRVISRLQRIRKAGLFSDETKGMKSIWDECCWHQANYDDGSGMMSDAFEKTIDTMVLALVQEIEPAEAVLLTCAAAEDQDGMPHQSDDIICSTVREMVMEAASIRDMSRFEVY